MALGLLTAIGAYTLPVFVRAIWGVGDRVAMTLVHVDDDRNEVVVAVSNQGERDATLKSAEFFLEPSTAADAGRLGWRLRPPRDRVLSADSTRQVTLESEQPLPREAGPFEHSVDHAILITIVRHDGSEQEFRLTFESIEWHGEG